MNKKRLFASTRSNGSAQSGLARVSAAFVVLIGVVLLVMSGCAGDVTVPVSAPGKPKPEDPLNPPDSYLPAPGLAVTVAISAGTVTQGGEVTLSATVRNDGPGRSREYALLVFYRSDDAIISPDLLSGDMAHNIRTSAELAISDAMNSGLGLDPVFYADFIKRSLAADQNVQEAIDERASQNAREGITGIILDPVIDSKRIERLAVNQVSEVQTITIPSTADIGTSHYGACVILVGFECDSATLVVTAAPVPDLVPASPAAPVFNKLTYAANETVTVSIKVRNGGGADSTDGMARLYREAGDEDVQIGEPIALGTIAAGDTLSFTTTFVTAELFGVHQQEYYFVIDTVNDEVNSSNNYSGPGLIVVSQENLIDVDGDKLIDIYTLDMLDNIRYNLAGTSYKTSAADTGNACGESADIDCIGYELMRDLDFTKRSSYENNQGKPEWLPNRYNPDQATNAGWAPLGGTDYSQGIREKAFSAIFEGNGHHISNLYARSDGASGLFNVITGTIRNLTVVNGNVYGGSNPDRVGIVAATVYEGMMINCAARGGSASGGHKSDEVGGLVGSVVRSTVAASYSSANVHAIGYGQVGVNSRAARSIRNSIGGLVGMMRDGTLIASYASGTVHGGTGSDDKLGGLVGSADRTGRVNSTISANYATGNVYGGIGAHEKLGGIVGSANRTGFTANYATGNVDVGGQWSGHFSRFLGDYFVRRGANTVVDSYAFGSILSRSFITINWLPDKNYPVQPLQEGSPTPRGVILIGDLTASNASPSWNSASSHTAGAWAFDASYGGPALKYADYDGDGGVDYCAHLPTGACSGNRLLPNQPVLDQGGSRQSAYVIDTQFYPGVGVTIPAKLTVGDTDYFQITVKQAGLLTIESNSGINTQATLYTSNGIALEYDDDDGAGDNFKISRAVSRGVFRVRAYGDSNQAGSYTLDIDLTECSTSACGGGVETEKYDGPVASLTACPVFDGRELISSSIAANVVSCIYQPTVACPDFQGWKLNDQSYILGDVSNSPVGTICFWRKRS